MSVIDEIGTLGFLYGLIDFYNTRECMDINFMSWIIHSFVCYTDLAIVVKFYV